MVAVIKTSKSLHRVFNYNENKIKDGVAQIIGAENYPVDPDEMSVAMRLNRLLRQTGLRPNVQVNTVHISLNFAPSESHFENEKLMEITSAYMDKIGFGEQPYLVYRHHDAGHPHCHIVTTNITADGGRIELHHLAINKSEQARKDIEKSFGLVVAGGRENKLDYEVQPIAIGKVKYGRIQSKKALTTVLDNVLPVYKYASLAELNAVLRQYNILADRGSEDSRVFKANGLVYRILDEQGNPVGVPIKASDFYNKPTLKFLEGKFSGNVVKRLPHKVRIKNAVDMALLGGKASFSDFIKTLEKQGIHVAVRQNDTGLIYGLTYVDHTTKCVFNGSALGKSYSAKAILERCQPQDTSGQHLASDAAQRTTGFQPQAGAAAAETKDTQIPSAGGNLLEALMQPEFAADYLPNQLKGKRKKRKKRNRNNNNL